MDYETKSTYTLTVSVSDGEAADSITVTVSVTNLVEDGTITLSSRQPQVGTDFHCNPVRSQHHVPRRHMGVGEVD